MIDVSIWVWISLSHLSVSECMENSVHKFPLYSIVVECLWIGQISFRPWPIIWGAMNLIQKEEFGFSTNVNTYEWPLWAVFCSLLRFFSLFGLWGGNLKESKKKSQNRFCIIDCVWPTFSLVIYLFIRIFAFKEWREIIEFKNSISYTKQLCQSKSLKCDCCLDQLWRCTELQFLEVLSF